jgi:hypothetical protein
MTNTDHRYQEYVFEAGGALAFLQLIEHFLKLYIEYSFKLAAVHLSGKMPFRFTGDDFKNAPLERLLATFGKLSDNNDLINALEKLKEKRNFFAHKGFVQYFEKPDIDEEHYQKSLGSAKKIKEEAMKVFSLLFVEVSNLNKRIMGLGQHQVVPPDAQNDVPR